MQSNKSLFYAAMAILLVIAITGATFCPHAWVRAFLVTFSLGLILLQGYWLVWRPLSRIESGAARFAKGELGNRIPVDFETGPLYKQLAVSLNAMAVRLSERTEREGGRRNEQEAILFSMREGVVVVDLQEHVLRMNRAAGELLGIEPLKVVGLGIQEALRHAGLQRFVKQVLSSESMIKDDLIIEDERGEHALQVYGRVLLDSEQRPKAGLVVLNDVTELERLENVRREFVANVSHELRTPITSIKGFVETLLDGAMANPDDTKHFLEIIFRHSERLNAIIEDLLSLSRIEREKERGEIELTEGSIERVLQTAVQGCQYAAQGKGISVGLSCPSGLVALINPPLLEQAVVNLIDNAIKYSDMGRKVWVEALSKNGRVGILVRDEGRGIENTHLSRLFERFYRVDKARSRKEGGTGLGLAIVKHIAQAHGGYPEVESELGKGSSFYLWLPAVEQKPL